MEELASGQTDPLSADQRVREIDAALPAWRGPVRLCAFVLVSAGIATLIGGGWREMILLVPGSIGMRSLASLVDQEVIPGLETAFLAALVAVALTIGMILASVLVPPKIAL